MTTNALPDDMRRLLEAVVAALDVPLPDVAEDDALRADLLAHRACDVRIICSSALQDNNIQGAADHLQQWTASRPVSYRSWQDRTGVGTDALDADPDQPVPYLPADRCDAAHPNDPTPCDGPAVVTVLDASNAGADGCEHHAARLLASLERGRVYGLPDAPPGAAIRVHKAAGDTRPFAWMGGQS